MAANGRTRRTGDPLPGIQCVKVQEDDRLTKGYFEKKQQHNLQADHSQRKTILPDTIYILKNQILRGFELIRDIRTKGSISYMTLMWNMSKNMSTTLLKYGLGCRL